MSQESNSQSADPMALWRSIQDANIEAWTHGMAAMINTDAYTQAMSRFLDKYLATSAPFRKIIDQYMQFWLSSMNLPSREEITRVEQRLVTSEIRLNVLSSQIDHVLQALQQQATHVMALANDQTIGIAQIESHIQQLDSSSDTIHKALNQLQAAVLQETTSQQLTQLAQHIQQLQTKTDDIVQLARNQATQQERTAEIATLTQEFKGMEEDIEERTIQISRALHEQATQSHDAFAQHGKRIGDVEARLASVDDVSRNILEIVQQLEQQQRAALAQPQVQTTLPETIPDAGTLHEQQIHIAAIEARMDGLDEKTEQVLYTLHTLQATLEQAAKTKATTTRTRKPRTTQSSSEPATEKTV